MLVPAVNNNIVLHSRITILLFHKVTQDLMRCKTADGISPELVNLVPGAWHMPFHINGGTPFVEQTLRAIDVACVPQPTAKLIETLQNFDAEKYQSTQMKDSEEFCQWWFFGRQTNNW